LESISGVAYEQSAGRAVASVSTTSSARQPLFAPRYARNFDLFGIGWDHLELCMMQEKIKLATGRFPSSCFQHNSGFENVHRRNGSRFGFDYDIQELLSLWLRQENGK
jgi:hypothetical protein